jgi:hypothetical protein
MRKDVRFHERDDLLILSTLEWYNFSPLSKEICCRKYKKTCPAEDGGVMGLMKSQTPFRKQKIMKNKLQGHGKKLFFTNKFLTLITSPCKFERISTNERPIIPCS